MSSTLSDRQPHRIVLRALAGAIPGGLAAAVALVVGLLLVTQSSPGPREMGLVLLTAWLAGAGTLAGLLVAESLVLRLSLGWRLPALLALSVVLELVVVLVVHSVVTTAGGGTPQDVLARLRDTIGKGWREPIESLPGVIGLTPLALLGAARTLPSPLPVWRQVLLAIAGGAAVFLLCALCWGAPEAGRAFRATLVFSGTAAAGTLGLALGPPLERRVLRALDQEDEPAPLQPEG